MKLYYGQKVIGIFQEHITTAVGRYRGQIVVWGVVNEAVADDDSLRDAVWSRGIGSDRLTTCLLTPFYPSLERTNGT